MTIGEATGLAGLLRSLLLDRPRVKIIVYAVHHAPPSPGVIGIDLGKRAYVEVHVTSQQPVRITRVAFELDSGRVVDLTEGARLPATITRPELAKRAIGLSDLRKAALADGAKGRIRRVRVEASPDRVFKQNVPKEWRKFPGQDPPMRPGKAEGVFVAWV